MRALVAAEKRVSYNLSDGKIYDRYALADITKRILGFKPLRFFLPMRIVKLLAALLEKAFGRLDLATDVNKEKLRESKAESWNCSNEKIQKDLGYTPEYDLEQGLVQTLKWYKEYHWLR
jgi:nucleoside-diphosphate-sugar epimerase